MPRLQADGLARLPAAVQRPAFDRAALSVGIVHLGLGAFHRAHQAVVNDAAIEATGDGGWGLCGVSLRQPDTRDALAPQQGLYTLALRDADEQGRPRQRLQVVGSLIELLVAPEDPQAVLERIAAPGTRIVSLTVTEKGYHHDPASGALRIDDADVQHDLVHPASPRTALGFIVHGLALRRARGWPPLTLLSCDNLPANGHLLRGLVLAMARQVDPALADWIGTACSFPACMVDRIVPRTTEADRAQVSAALGAEDAWPVIGEPFLDWVIEDRFAAGRPAWEHGGARFVADVAPFELAKLRLLNGTHSTLAYLGAMAGLRTVDQAVREPLFRQLIETLMATEIIPTLPATPGFDLAAYSARIVGRYANPALQHRLRQIAMDGSQKLPQRLLGTVRHRLQQGAGIELLALAVAGWLHHLSGVDEAGEAHAVDDPLAGTLAALRAQGGAAAVLAHAPVFGDLAGQAAFSGPVLRWLQSLQQAGVRATLQQALGGLKGATA
ncbi:mannitol dehydrogenase family protein [Aquincola tertiaricarbonis]|uniref:mannitol dehydrogenase family protein n=1 Tax=Aquincola tertiaricarbonis TaxID=391953 RepID=UPI000614B18A|nr:mannitol dehydrogenase family protein [Aquincola tertiaricarbonis]